MRARIATFGYVRRELLQKSLLDSGLRPTQGQKVLNAVLRHSTCNRKRVRRTEPELCLRLRVLGGHLSNIAVLFRGKLSVRTVQEAVKTSVSRR